MVLALQYRPVRFAEVVGQSHIKPILQAMVRTGNVPPAMIFAGTRGTGKTTCARILAAALNCASRDDSGDACGDCVQCRSVQRTTSTSVLEVDAASNGGIEEVRKIKDICLYSHEAEWRVVLLDEAHSMSKEAFNALLKLLEEPPKQTVFVLLTTEVEKILETVRSRSIPFEFRRMKQADIVGRLQHIAAAEGYEVQPDLLTEIANRAQGGMRDAVMLLDQVSRVGVSDAEGFRELFGLQDVSIPLMWAAIREDHGEGYRLIGDHFARTGDAAGLVADFAKLVAQVLVIKSEGVLHLAERAIDERVELARAVSVGKLVKAVEVLWELKSRTRATENDQRSAMELGFALIANALRDAPREAETPSTPILREQTSRKMSLAEMQKMATGRH